jgi:hypothetical protein
MLVQDAQPARQSLVVAGQFEFVLIGQAEFILKGQVEFVLKGRGFTAC